MRNFEELDEELPKEKEARKEAITTEIAKLEPIVLKLGKEYAIIRWIQIPAENNFTDIAQRSRICALANC